MMFLSWQSAALLAAGAVPALLILYFLKLKRQERTISSTLLWKKAIQDLQVNAPFQKLRKNLLLFLQLLILAAILLALSNPISNFLKEPERRVVLLIDRSGSMKSIEDDGRARLEHARDAAKQLVNNLSGDSQAMVVSFSDAAQVVCSFTDDKRRLRAALDAVEPTDAASNIGEALQLAVAHSSNFIEDTGFSVPQAAASVGVEHADLELFSDGRLTDAADQQVVRGNLHYHQIGEAADNAGIVQFSVVRDYERPGMLTVFVSVENFGPRPVASDLSISLNGKPLTASGSIQEISLGPAVAEMPESNPASADAATAASVPGSAVQNVIFDLQHETGGLLEIKLHREDALSIDNLVSAILPPPRQVRVLVVSDNSTNRYFFTKAFAGFDFCELELMNPEDYESAADEQLIEEGRSLYDVVFFDAHDTERLPPGQYLFFGGIPKIEGVSSGADVQNQAIVLWRQNHPLLRYVDFDALMLWKWKELALPPQAQTLVEAEKSTVMAMLNTPGHVYVIAAFRLDETDLPIKPAFPILLQNAVMTLAGASLMDDRRLVRPGETLTLTVPPGATEVRVTRPDASQEKLDVKDRYTVPYAATRETGVYLARFNDDRNSTEGYAVNLTDPNESRIAPNDTLSIGKEPIETHAGEVQINQPLWPWLILFALAVLMVEWWVYNRRVMI